MKNRSFDQRRGCSGMNAAIRAVVRTAVYKGMQVYGIRRGFNGLINGEIDQMDVKSVGEILHRGGTHSQHSPTDRLNRAGMKKAVNVLKIFGIEGLVVIGGDGSFRGALDLSKRGIPTVGVPGTIDNDIACTEQTIGFDTAVNTVLEAINKIRDTVTSHERTKIIEVMGRHAGDIAIYTGIAGGAEGILIPEMPLDIDNLCRRIIEGRNRGKSPVSLSGGRRRKGHGIGTYHRRKRVWKPEQRCSATSKGAAVPQQLILYWQAEWAIMQLSYCSKISEIGWFPSEAIGLWTTTLREALTMPKKFNQELYDLHRYCLSEEWRWMEEMNVTEVKIRVRYMKPTNGYSSPFQLLSMA